MISLLICPFDCKLLPVLQNFTALSGMVKQLILLLNSIQWPRFDIHIQLLCCQPESSLDKIGLINVGILQYLLNGFEMFFLKYFQSHLIVFIINLLIDLIIDYDFIGFVTHMQENAALVSALCFPGKIFAILYGSK